MKRIFEDLTGRVFWELTVIGFGGFLKSLSGNKITTWLCLCSCGSRVTVRAGNLKNGHTRSCGHLASLNLTIQHLRQTTHGQSKHPLYSIWKGIIDRCCNKKCKHYPSYGGRGICVCERWKWFPNFLADMEPTWKPGLTIERKDNNGNYCPENCIWADMRTQANNKRNNHKITVDGVTKTIAQWSRDNGYSNATICERLTRGWDPERAATWPTNFLAQRKNAKAGDLPQK